MKFLPLLSWDIFSDFYFRNLENAQKQSEARELSSLAKKHHWKNNIDDIINSHQYEAIIVTDIHQKIIWVNDGFTQMTGYSKNFALKKSPSFLQGPGTSLRTRKRIRKKIKNNKPFKEVILNYKKDQTSYECEVKIIPLYNNETTHYIALERKVG